MNKEAFKALVKLTKLELGFNLLITVESYVFYNLKALELLNLNDNKLKYVSANLLTPLTKLKAVNLTNNICIDKEHPNSSLVSTESKIIDSCIAPIKLQCRIEEPTTNSEIKPPGRLCSC